MMKKLLLILICLFVSFEVNSELRWKGELGQKLLEFNYIDGLYYKKFSDTPFTGKVNYTAESGYNVQGKIVNGQMEGTWLGFTNNGKLYKKENFRNGWLHGYDIQYNPFINSNVAIKSHECLNEDGFVKNCTYYWKNQNIKLTVNYIIGENPFGELISAQHGEKKRYSEFGSLIEKSIWCKGTELERWTYNSLGDETYEEVDKKYADPSCK